MISLNNQLLPAETPKWFLSWDALAYNISQPTYSNNVKSQINNSKRRIDNNLERQISDNIESQVENRIESQIESQIDDNLESQIDDYPKSQIDDKTEATTSRKFRQEGNCSSQVEILHPSNSKMQTRSGQIRSSSQTRISQLSSSEMQTRSGSQIRYNAIKAKSNKGKAKNKGKVVERLYEKENEIIELDNY